MFIFGFLMVGTQIYQNDQKEGIERDIYNFTENVFDFKPLNLSLDTSIEKSPGIINKGRINKIIISGANFVFISIEEVLKMGIEYGYQNPNINFEKIFKLIIAVLIIYIIVLLLKPIGYIIVFLIMGGIYFKDKLNKRKNDNKRIKH